MGFDGGYDIGAVHRRLELLEGYTGIPEQRNEKGFSYEAATDCFVYRHGEYFEF